MGDFPKVVAEAAKHRTPHRIANYIQETAAAFHSFYNAEKVLDASNKEQTEARLALITAVRTTIANALRLIGVSAPEKKCNKVFPPSMILCWGVFFVAWMDGRVKVTDRK